MRVKLKTWRVCRHGTMQRPGQEIDLPDDEAQRLIAVGPAVFSEPETMAVVPPENAAMRRPKARIMR